MDFYEAQDQARRASRRLIWIFSLAVLVTIGLTYLVVDLAWVSVVAFGVPNTIALSPSPFSPAQWSFDGIRFFVISLCVLLVVVGGTMYRLASLRSGGRAIAESLGGRRVVPGSGNPQERRLLNVVEEMSIAAGLPVPPVYVLDEPGINAFAAGRTPRDAVLAFTQGTMQRLSRDQLQGVVGHELSHVLNGDIKLNMDLLALLFGLLVIGLSGKALLRLARREPRLWPLWLAGGALFAIGYISYFAGNLIKAAVNRQREYLADSAAVQFTRDAKALAGALKQIGAHTLGSRLAHPKAEELSHLFFSNVAKTTLSAMATHPPLATRIKRLDPYWDGKFPRLAEGTAAPQSETTAANAAPEVQALGADDGAAVGRAAARPDIDEGVHPHPHSINVDSIRESTGRPAADSVDAAKSWLHEQDDVAQLARDPASACAVIYALLLSEDRQVAEQQMQHLRAVDAAAASVVTHHMARLTHMPRRYRLPTVQLCLPALQQLSAPQYDNFIGALKQLAHADRHVDLFEWMLYHVVQSSLRPHFVKEPAPRFRRIEQLPGAIAAVLAAVAHSTGSSAVERDAAYRRALDALDWQGRAAALPKGVANANPPLRELSAALAQLRQLYPLTKPKLLKACIAAMHGPHDGDDDARDLLVTIAAALDCPLPLQFGG